ncbi:MAG TPA: hypothetical protein VN228_04310, partial [Pyrinomonadaceae bacterium]|nr:hypothetical protein [Pyrinomonadaceae bacterium]
MGTREERRESAARGEAAEASSAAQATHYHSRMEAERERGESRGAEAREGGAADDNDAAPGRAG